MGGNANQGSLWLETQSLSAMVGIVLNERGLGRCFGVYLRIRITSHPIEIVMINLKMGVETRFGIRVYMRTNFGSP